MFFTVFAATLTALVAYQVASVVVMFGLTLVAQAFLAR